MDKKQKRELLEKLKMKIVEQSHKETDIKVAKGLHKAEKIVETEINNLN